MIIEYTYKNKNNGNAISRIISLIWIFRVFTAIVKITRTNLKTQKMINIDKQQQINQQMIWIWWNHLSVFEFALWPSNYLNYANCRPSLIWSFLIHSKICQLIMSQNQPFFSKVIFISLPKCIWISISNWLLISIYCNG